jgi:hypothetical protein
MQRVAKLSYVTYSKIFSYPYTVGDPHFREDNEYIGSVVFGITKKLLSINIVTYIFNATNDVRALLTSL